MTSNAIDKITHDLLLKRVGKIHLKQRLGLERDYEQRIFGQGRNFFHIENWYSIHSLIRNSLRLLLLLERGRRNARRIEVRHNRIDLEALPQAFEGYTILQISDPHLDMSPDFPHALIQAVRKVHYDLCVMTGDFRAGTFGPHDAAVDGMRLIRTHLEGEVYGVLGNHDTILMVPAFEAMGIRMLLNEYVTIMRGPEGFILAGIDDPHYYRADNLEKAADTMPPDMITILLAHSPEIFRHAAHADFDVMFCGHTHGGQICLPGGLPLMYNARCPRAYCNGAWTYNNLHGYTSAGSGSSIVDVRLNCPPEITLHHLHRC